MIDCTDISELIPHSGTMILLDKIIEFDERSLSAEIVVRENTLLSNSKEVPSWVGIEYMAQAIAAFAGIQSKQAGKTINIGLLLGTRRYISNIAAFDVGIVLTVKITKLIHDEKLGVFDCKIYGTGIEISANLNVYQPFNEN